MRIDRRRKLPATTLLYALGLDKEEILSIFYGRVAYKKVKNGWTTPFIKENWRGVKPLRDLVDAKTGEVIAPAGKKIAARVANKLAEDGVKNLLVSSDDLAGRFVAEDIVNAENR